jgi:hypothetical protein
MTTPNRTRPRPIWLVALFSTALFVLAVGAVFGVNFLNTLTNSPVAVLVLGGFALVMGAALSGLLIVVQVVLNQPPSNFFRGVLWGTIVSWLVLLSLAAVPYFGARYINENHPMLVPRVTLTNGDKEVVFQGMVHIGSEPYYQAVVFDMVEAADDGYTLFFEGVGDGTPANEKRLNSLVGAGGVNFTDVYTTAAKICGLQFQSDYFRVFRDDMQTNPEKYVLADVTTDDMIAEWDKLLATNPELGETQRQTMPDGDALTQNDLNTVIRWVNDLTGGQRENIALLCQAAFNTALRSNTSSLDTVPFLQKVVLDFRDEALVDRIVNFDGKKIYVTYGAGHFDGTLARLRAQDKRWQVAEVTWQPVIVDMHQYESRLREP